LPPVGPDGLELVRAHRQIDLVLAANVLAAVNEQVRPSRVGLYGRDAGVLKLLRKRSMSLKSTTALN
jgi:hypothetical protein